MTVTTKSTTAPTDTPRGLRVITLTAENFKRLKAVQINPAEHVQIIGGSNAAGKTSCLDAVFAALGGGAAARTTTRPIREGQDRASVRLDLGDLIVTRKWVGDKTTLTVESADGAKYPSPQAVLDTLVGRLSFDPLEFTNLSQRDQLAALIDLVDLPVDLEALAAERRGAYEQRTIVGRQGKDLDGQVAGAGPVEDSPITEVSVSDLVTEYRTADAMHRVEREARETLAAVEQLTVHLKAKFQDDKAALEARFKAEMAAADHRIKGASATLSGLPAKLPDLEVIQKQMDTAEATNQAVRRNIQRTDLATRVKACRLMFEGHTATIERVDKAKADALAAAKFPVEGLSFDSTGVLFNGIPFSQASSAEQIRVSLAMAMALNPKLRVILVRDASLLDAKNLKVVEEMAAGNDWQIWLEIVTADKAVGVIIEDGQVSA